MANDTVRNIGFEGDLTVVQVMKPTTTTNVTPVLSAAWDTTNIGRKRILLAINVARTANGADFTVTESATSGGTYTAATVSGTLTNVATDSVRYVSVRRNPAKPFIKVTCTGDNASTSVIWGVTAIVL